MSLFNFFVGKNVSSEVKVVISIERTTLRLESANMMLLSKEMTDKERSMKSQLLISTSTSNEDERLSGERVWKRNGFFKDIKPELNLEKVNMA